MTTVFANGVFDLIHTGHVDFLKQARALGDRLIVGINSDASVRALKGPGRPVFGQDDRRDLLLALRCVDQCVIFGQEDAADLVKQLRPDVLAKGDEYREHDGRLCREAVVVLSYGGRVAYIPRRLEISTSTIMKRIHDCACPRIWRPMSGH
jgi:rfaE bifunctional protein nucleotidyltransferase chain/domain